MGFPEIIFFAPLYFARNTGIMTTNEFLRRDMEKKRDNSYLDMTRGTPWKLIAGFAVPVFLSQLFQQLYNTVDSHILGKFLGTD